MKKTPSSWWLLGLLLAVPAQAKKYAPPPPFYTAGVSTAAFRVAPPPAPDSEADRQDLAAVREWQSRRTPQDCARANAEAVSGYEAFFGALSPWPLPLPPEAEELTERVRADSEHVIYSVKGLYQRPRPFQRDEALTPCLPRSAGYAYPSGHSTLAHLFALVLSDLVPDQSSSFEERAREVALDRVIGGVHHPSDIAAGQDLARQIHAQLLKNPAYLADLDKVRGLLKP